MMKTNTKNVGKTKLLCEVVPTLALGKHSKAGTKTSVGDTVVASMRQSSVDPKVNGAKRLANAPLVHDRRRYRDLFADGHMTTSVDTLVLQITKHACLGLGSKGSVVWEIVSSLIWPLVCWLNKEGSNPAAGPLRNLRELNRFKNSARCTARAIHEVISEDNREQSFCKFWLDSLLCRAARDPQRPVREPWMVKPLFTGWIKKLLNRVLARKTIDVGLIYSLQKGSKKAWPALGKVKEQQALDKHKARLSELHGNVPTDIRTAIQKAAQEVFKGIESMQPTKFMPTGSACMQASRKRGGALSLTKRYTLDLDSGDAKIMGRLPYLSATLDNWRKEEFAKFEDVCRKRIEEGKMEDLTRVKVLAVPEPGKFRIVTLGDGYLYSALQPLQGLMLKCWKSHNASTMLRDDLTERVQEIGRDCASLPFWCSVDYEAATDLLKRDATLAAFEGMCRRLEKEIELPGIGLAAISLLEGVAVYPDRTECNAREGQLMGHPLSFPFLCVINLAVYRCAIDRWVALDPFSRTEIGRLMWDNVLVNGDDMLFKCEHSFYEIFLKAAKDAGFKISQGKQYLSPDFCMINSQIFSQRPSGIVRRGYLNLKLLTGISLKGGESEATPTMVGRDLNKMMELAPWTSSTIPFAFQRWAKDKWQGQYYKPNWFLPVHLGGFGVDRKWAREGLRITRGQRLMAARFVNDPRMALYRREGMDIPTAKLAGGLAKWRMIPGDYVPRAGESSDVSDGWLARLALASRAHHGSSKVSDSVFVAKFKPEYRLKPMSMEALERYWNAQVFAFNLPHCPAVRPLRVRGLGGDYFVSPGALKSKRRVQYLLEKSRVDDWRAEMLSMDGDIDNDWDFDPDYDLY